MAAEEKRSDMQAGVECVCPFCDAELDVSAPWCQVCQVMVRFCAVCGEPLPKDADECPGCGAAGEE